MKKNFFILPQVGLVCIFLLLLNYSCKKDIQENEQQRLQEEIPTTAPIEGGDAEPCMEILENYNTNSDSVEYATILGNQLIGNPYSISVMQQAAINLYGNSNGISVNKKYLRFRPTNEGKYLSFSILILNYSITR